MTNEEREKIWEQINYKRTQIGECLFSSQRYHHPLSNARRLVKLASELAELVAIVETRQSG